MESGIVISGMSGKFPESDNIAELQENLLNKVDMVTDNDKRWRRGIYGIPVRSGVLKDISKFDNKYFQMSDKQASDGDPQLGIILEVAHECILDAGYDPVSLRGRNIGVFVGNCESDNLRNERNDPMKINAFGVTGNARSMFANRISYICDFTGPSSIVDTACSSSLYALHQGVRAILNGDCDAALVGGANLCLNPLTTLQFLRMQMLSAEGKCKAFDADCSGFVRSEAIAFVFLQKAEAARRKYASIVHSNTNNDGYKLEGAICPSVAGQIRLSRQVYEECKLSPLAVSYLETHGTGTSVGDVVEMSAVEEELLEGRKEPLH